MYVKLGTRKLSVRAMLAEIAALAIFLDRFTEGKALYEDRNGRMTVIPNERGKTVVNKDLPE